MSHCSRSILGRKVRFFGRPNGTLHEVLATSSDQSGNIYVHFLKDDRFVKADLTDMLFEPDRRRRPK